MYYILCFILGSIKIKILNFLSFFLTRICLLSFCFNIMRGDDIYIYFIFMLRQKHSFSNDDRMMFFLLAANFIQNIYMVRTWHIFFFDNNLSKEKFFFFFMHLVSNDRFCFRQSKSMFCFALNYNKGFISYLINSRILRRKGAPMPLLVFFIQIF